MIKRFPKNNESRILFENTQNSLQQGRVSQGSFVLLNVKTKIQKIVFTGIFYFSKYIIQNC